MIKSSLGEIRTKALGLHQNQAPWHFHILSPSCIFNDRKQFAFILEDIEDEETYVYYSDRSEKQLGSELAPLLHGKEVFAEGIKKDISTEARNIIERATSLNQKGLEWHHHVLFPGCRFNDNSPRYTLVLEDPESKTTLTSVTDTEPKAELSLLEPLFYAKG